MTLVDAGRHRHLAVGFDADSKLGANKVETFGSWTPAQQACRGEPDLCLRGAGDHCAVMVTYRNGADAHRGAAVLVAFQYGAADVDVEPVTEIFCHRSREPRPHRDAHPLHYGA